MVQQDLAGTGGGTPEAPGVFCFPPQLLVGTRNTAFYVTAADIALWRQAYPALDVNAELRRMVAWLSANPARRKTIRGMRSFINAWLAKSQNSAHLGRGPVDPRAQALRAWYEVREYLRGPRNTPKWSTPHTARVLEQMGGLQIFRDLTVRDVEFKKRDFELLYIAEAAGGDSP